MKLATSHLISEIDNYAEKVLKIPTVRLMALAGEAVAKAALGMTAPEDKILVLSGKGNNGGDGYAAAHLLAKERDVSVVDVFSGGQRSEAGVHFLRECESANIKIIRGTDTVAAEIESASLIIDAIFGTGYSGKPDAEMARIAELINSSGKTVLAVDLPLGVNADTATVSDGALRADATVALSLKKPAHICYPAKEYMGAVSSCTLGLDEYFDNFEYSFFSTDDEHFKRALPKRAASANKGSFGKTVHITGSEKYRGAAHLALEASLRSGVGIVYHAGGGELAYELRQKFPEAIYVERPTPKAGVDPIFDARGKYSSVLLGSGSSVSRDLADLAVNIISTDGAPLILDADGINSIAEFYSAEILKEARRTVILTPHPLELSRLSGQPVEYINKNRLPFAMSFAKEYGVILLLKGAGTVITDGNRAYINTSGSTALSKGGSGDVLAGVCASFVATSDDLVGAVAAAAYIHGRAGDTLSAELSDYGVTPSDLPKEIARHIKLLLG